MRLGGHDDFARASPRILPPGGAVTERASSYDASYSRKGFIIIGLPFTFFTALLKSRAPFYSLGWDVHPAPPAGDATVLDTTPSSACKTWHVLAWAFSTKVAPLVNVCGIRRVVYTPRVIGLSPFTTPGAARSTRVYVIYKRRPCEFFNFRGEEVFHSGMRLGRCIAPARIHHPFITVSILETGKKIVRRSFLSERETDRSFSAETRTELICCYYDGRMMCGMGAIPDGRWFLPRFPFIFLAF